MDVALARGSTAVQRRVPEPAFRSVRGLARYVAVAGLAGLTTGIVVGGIGGRLFMRIAGAVAPERARGAGTEAGFTVGEVTVGGTIALIVIVGIFVGIIGAVIYAASIPWLMWARRWRGLLVGVVLFAAGSATSDVMNPDNVDFFILENEVLLVGLIVALFLGFGLFLDWMARVFERRVSAVGDRWRAIDGVFIAIAVVGFLLTVAIVPVLFTPAACDCDPPLGASWSMVLMGGGTVLWWASGLMATRRRRIRTLAGVFGYLGLAGVLAFGLIRAVSDAIDIVA